MENKGIWDILNTLTAGLGDKTKGQNQNEKQNKPQNDKSNLNCNAENGGNNKSKSQNKFCGTMSGQDKSQNNKDNSYMKSYNPFICASIQKPQITSAHAQKPAKNFIDLSASKNLAGNSKSDSSENIIRLINRHNIYLKQINSKQHPQ